MASELDDFREPRIVFLEDVAVMHDRINNLNDERREMVSELRAIRRMATEALEHFDNDRLVRELLRDISSNAARRLNGR